MRPVGRRVGAHLGLEAAAPAAVAVILALASVLSWLPGSPMRGAVAGAVGGPAEPHVLTPITAPGGAPGRASDRDDTSRAIQNDTVPADATPEVGATAPTEAADRIAPPPNRELTRIDPDAVAAAGAPATSPPATGPLLSDGTLVKPIAVDTAVPDGKHLIRIHRTVKGESLTTIAERYNVSMMTIWWANDLKSHNLLVGKTLAVPPVDGLVHVVTEGDTLASLAKEHDIHVEPIREVNGLDDPVLVPGQTLILPGAAGEPIPEPEPRPAPPAEKPGASWGGNAGGASGGQGNGAAQPPAAYSGGRMVWPVVGGNNFVSRGFASGHYGLDIAGDHGARVVAAAGGTVIFAGWKPNGGGYQVWIAHGSGVFTTYNHLSAVSVGNGQGVGAGQMIGRLGNSGNSTGPHLHFEVWQGEVWSGGDRVNPASRL
jgi:murein DD-endopeptidase MepM/ murein hydrolase activator NlpD